MRHLEDHRLWDVHVRGRVGVTLDGGDEFRLAGPGGYVSTFARQAQCSTCPLFGFHALSVGSLRKQAASDAPIPRKNRGGLQARLPLCPGVLLVVLRRGPGQVGQIPFMASDGRGVQPD